MYSPLSARLAVARPGSLRVCGRLYGRRVGAACHRLVRHALRPACRNAAMRHPLEGNSDQARVFCGLRRRARSEHDVHPRLLHACRSRHAAALDYCLRGRRCAAGHPGNSYLEFLLPEIARLRSLFRLREAFRLIDRTTAMAALAAVAGCGFALLFREPAIRIIFQRGAFRADSTALVSAVFLTLGPSVIAGACWKSSRGPFSPWIAHAAVIAAWIR